MSVMLMRNYQKLIKIKKGPKVKDLLITVPCKSPIIREHESEPNTAKNLRKCAAGLHCSLPCTLKCTVHANPFSPYIQRAVHDIGAHISM